MDIHWLRIRNRLARSGTIIDRAGAGFRPEIDTNQLLTSATSLWSVNCSSEGMRSTRGFTMFELLIVMALIAIFAAMGIPTLQESTKRNAVWTASETIGTQVRQARLKAISRNRSFRVRFDCPVAGQFRVLVVTGNSTIDTHTNRCSMQQTHDSGIYAMPATVSYGTPPVLTVTSRGVFTASSGSIPATIAVTNGTSTRELTVSATGQINFEVY